MQATADGAGTLTGTIHTERRPVRLLVPTERRTIWYVPQEDTLRAADLDLSRDTDDGQLARMVPGARKMLKTAGLTEDPEAYLRRIRDGLRHPRDIAEARAWGMVVPEEQNVEEFDPRPTRRTGWWWVLDPTRTETRDEREARLLADTRLLDMKGVARVWQRKYITVKDFKVESERVRRMLREPSFLRAEAIKRLAKGKGVHGDISPVSTLAPLRAITALRTDIDAADVAVFPDGVDVQELVDPYGVACDLADVEATMADELAYARKFVHKAMPPRRARAGQSDVWYVGDACQTGRDTTRLTEWYEFNTVRQTGRPPGSRTRNRRPHAAKTID